MSGPPPDPSAKRRNSGFQTIYRDPDREIPAFPQAILETLPPSAQAFAKGYWRDQWIELGDVLRPNHGYVVARAAALFAQWLELGVECPGVVLTNLSKLEDSFGGNERALRHLRLQVVDKPKDGEAGAGPRKSSLAVVPKDLAARAG